MFAHRLVAALAVTLALVLVVAGAIAPTRAADKLAAGGKLPKFELETLAGGKTGSAALEGKKTVVVFFTTFSDECKEELPLLAALAKDRSVALLAISCDQGGKGLVETFAGSLKLERSSVAMFTLECVQGFGVELVPTTFLVGADGKVAARLDGFADKAALEKAFAKLGD